MLYLIDIDGTLLLSGGAGFVALNRAFLELHGVQEAMRDVRPGGMTDPAIVEQGFRTHLGRPPTAEEQQALLRRYLELLPDAVQRSEGFRLLAGVPSGLDRLARRGHHLGVATGNLRAGARIKLERAGLWSRFSYGGFADDAADRATLVRIAAERGTAQLSSSGPGAPVDPAQVVVVGDTPLDVAAARANGFAVVAVSSGTVAPERLRDAAPDRIVESLDEL